MSAKPALISYTCTISRCRCRPSCYGGCCPPSAPRRKFCTFWNRVADAYFFTPAAQGNEWLMKAHCEKVMPLMEEATFFDFESRDCERHLYRDREAAQKYTGMQGEPLLIKRSTHRRGTDHFSVT